MVKKGKYLDWKLDKFEADRISAGHTPGKKVNVYGKNLSVTWKGTVHNMDTKAVIEFNIDKGGFKSHSFRDGNKVRTVYLHKLLAIVWLGAKESSRVVHIDGDKGNNHVTNLSF